MKGLTSLLNIDPKPVKIEPNFLSVFCKPSPVRYSKICLPNLFIDLAKGCKIFGKIVIASNVSVVEKPASIIALVKAFIPQIVLSKNSDSLPIFLNLSSIGILSRKPKSICFNKSKLRISFWIGCNILGVCLIQ